MGSQSLDEPQVVKKWFFSTGAMGSHSHWKYVLSLFIIHIVTVHSQSAPKEDLGDRIECFPLVDSISEGDCLANGCLWDPTVGVPVNCYLPSIDEYGYKIYRFADVTPNGWKIELQRIDSRSLHGDDYQFIVFEVFFYTNDMFRFMLYPLNANVENLRPPVPLSLPAVNVTNASYEIRLVNFTPESPFHIQIIRKATGAILFDTGLGGLTMAKQFLMISTKLPSRYMYGIGENPHDSFAHDMNYKMWPIFGRDQPPGDGEMNLYGSHPFYTVSEDDGSSHGVFFFNSHSIDVTTLPAPGLTYRTIGGLMEFFIFMGPGPEEVIHQYTNLIGRPVMPPYWALGFQICRYGYTSTDDIKAVVDRTRAANIPQDIQYADIDYMDEQAIFTLGVNFTGLPNYVAEIKEEGTRFILILDPFVNTEKSSYVTHERAMEKDVYIKWFNSSYQPSPDCTTNPTTCQNLTDVMLGYVWPVGRAAFPDFFKQSTKEWWLREIEDLQASIQFDGLWIDMNEPANFDTNLDKPFNWPPERPVWNLKCPTNEWDDPPYITLAAKRSQSRRLSDKTICMVGKQGPNDEYLHYALHNLYGWSHTEPTLQAARQVTGKRSVVITRSTFASSGKWAGHWLGDNTSRWKDLRSSIIGMMEFNMFGISYVGADICGFFNDASEKLCQRWMELGAFYPFSRNHNGLGYSPQDPAVWESVASASRTALNIRYSLLPYLYTLFFHNHQTGSTVIRPLRHEYPTDLRAKTVDSQFLWGAAFLISPVLQEDQTQLSAYLPSDIWYDYYTGNSEPSTGDVVWETPLDKINLHVRGGHILPTQDPALNTMLSRMNNFGLIVALGADDQATGDLFWDDGESQDTIESGLYQHQRFIYENNSLRMEIAVDGTDTLDTLKMDSVRMFGLKQKPVSITVGGVPLSESQIDYNAVDKVMRLSSLGLSMAVNWQVQFNY